MNVSLATFNKSFHNFQQWFNLQLESFFQLIEISYTLTFFLRLQELSKKMAIFLFFSKRYETLRFRLNYVDHDLARNLNWRIIVLLINKF